MRLLSKKIYLFILIIQLFFIPNGFAQTDKKKLEKEKSTIQNQIKESQQILAETSSKKKASIGQLNAITKQIEGRTKLIRTYSSELTLLNSQIDEDEIVTNALQQDLENLKSIKNGKDYYISFMNHFLL